MNLYKWNNTTEKAFDRLKRNIWQFVRPLDELKKMRFITPPTKGKTESKKRLRSSTSFCKSSTESSGMKWQAQRHDFMNRADGTGVHQRRTWKRATII